MNIVVLRRRLFYLCAMVVLLVPLYFLGNPSVRNSDGSVKRPGGALAQLRTAYDLGQGDLGEIDPASESMRLATLGLRGVAATILWQKAEYYKREQYWDRLSATLNQIAVLQPHFVKVWEFQSHNLSYNVSVEFDDYRQRYQWVKRGMEYLVKGAKFNKKRSEMPYELGWFFGNKFGVSDERKQFRELYRNDENFHNRLADTSGLDVTQQDGLGPDRKPDNWLSGKLWYERAYEMVKAGSQPARSPLMFYRLGPQWMMKYAEGIQAEGVLDEPARYAWRIAGGLWRGFGDRPIKTTFGDTIFLRELERANIEYEQAREEFEDFCGDIYSEMVEQRKAQLGAEELAAYEKPELERNFQELMRADAAKRALTIAPADVAKALPEERQFDAFQLAGKVEAAREKITHIEIYRNQINYAYWAARCEAEQEDSALLARTSMYEANELLNKGELDAALEKYEIAWKGWADLFNRHPAMMVDDAADDVLDSIDRYRRLLDQPDLPEDFALRDFTKFREIFEDSLADPALMGVISDWPRRFPRRNFLEEMLRKSVVTYELNEKLRLESLPSIDVVAPDSGQAPAPQAPAATADEPAGTTEADDTPAAAGTGGGEADAPQPEPALILQSPDAGVAPSPKVPGAEN